MNSQEVPESIFGLQANDALVYQVYTVKLANQRRTYAHTKTRSEVRGGGRKPWRQKGTGRARHGSTRSPLWVGGGVTFGPRNERSFSKRINKKMNQKALAVVLSSMARSQGIYVIDSLHFEEPKTKHAAKLLSVLNKKETPTLIFGTKADENFTRVFRNISHAKPVSISRINIVDILQASQCIFSKEALQTLIAQYEKSGGVKRGQEPVAAAKPKVKSKNEKATTSKEVKNPKS